MLLQPFTEGLARLSSVGRWAVSTLDVVYSVTPLSGINFVLGGNYYGPDFIKRLCVGLHTVLAKQAL